MDTISRLAGHAASACVAAAILIGCSDGGGSPVGGFAPPEAMAPGGAATTLSVQRKQNFSHYYVVDLGTLGGTLSVANSINDRGWIAGISRISGNAAVHAVLWVNGQKVDLKTLGGPNSGVGWPVKNDRGEIVGISDLAQPDALAENFCGFASSDLCAGFQWKNNVLTPLPTLGGNNSFAAGVNDAASIVGFAETATRDAACGSPQVLDYFATIWKADGHPHALPPAQGDAVSQAVSIDSAGDAVGASGPCGPPNNLGYGTAHALLWKQGAPPTDLGNLGGSTANLATAINDRGDVVGQSAVTGNTTYHAFRWQQGSISDIGTLPGDESSEALGVNDKTQIVGSSCDAGGTCRGFIWQNGGIADLNLLVPHSQLYVTYAGDINDRGWIVGQAVDLKTGRAPAVLLIPTQGSVNIGSISASKVTLPESVRRALKASHGFRRFIQ
ncbi:MAG: hypothetical protein M3R51_00060 [Candidatus Eremiobacteraeota bacterium]|nr:hypothetical protein [Candidatus Eremiobacteraeota bacterium]